MLALALLRFWGGGPGIWTCRLLDVDVEAVQGLPWSQGGEGEGAWARPCGPVLLAGRSRSVRPLRCRTGTYVPPPVLLSQHLLHKGLLRNPLAARRIPQRQDLRHALRCAQR